ncbi:uncharacterized protein F4807DRAFT_408438 [Annulohypoxylon truncatum]|uniref:uncharacterized protein n=1 Tax=Annulohypoxylon truncatum TaxID=327061 RepID=UPI002008A8AE|nr:uncharacterized protein F4807DRAFT_408438 [Annulohypoxylon truncatum]KAI1213610.1 hypothetical protein F4807DRAFT_408438 [Annulohypoxylon truncatum]
MEIDNEQSELSEATPARQRAASSPRASEPSQDSVGANRPSWTCNQLGDSNILRFRRRPIIEPTRYFWVCTKVLQNNTTVRFSRRPVLPTTLTHLVCTRQGDSAIVRFRRRLATLYEVINEESPDRHARIDRLGKDARERRLRGQRKMLEDVERERANDGSSDGASSDASQSDDTSQSDDDSSSEDDSSSDDDSWSDRGRPPFREHAQSDVYMPQPLEMIDPDFVDFMNTGRHRTEPPTEDDLPLHLATSMCMGDAYTGNMMLDLFPGLVNRSNWDG